MRVCTRYCVPASNMPTEYNCWVPVPDSCVVGTATISDIPSCPNKDCIYHYRGFSQADIHYVTLRGDNLTMAFCAHCHISLGITNTMNAASSA